MSNDSYLICHVVRGQPTFDIAIRMECPECQGTSCDECDEGFWWIIPTSGHRAFPYWSDELIGVLQLAYDEQYVIRGQPGLVYDGESFIPDPPSGHPDHYQATAAKHKATPSGQTLADRLGLNVRQSSAPIRRRV